jgi:hypothetical protein
LTDETDEQQRKYQEAMERWLIPAQMEVQEDAIERWLVLV